MDAHSLDENAENELNELVKTLNKEFSETPAYSGNGKSTIKVQLIIQKREDWDEQGEKIELAEICKLKKPIS